MNANTVIEVKNINKTFFYKNEHSTISERFLKLFSRRERNEGFKALEDINFSVRKGEFFGIIGSNGSGKSTLLKIIMGAIKADEGSEIVTKGKMIRLALGMGFDRNLNARDNIYLNGTILGLTFKQIGNSFDQIIEFADLEKFINVPIKFYSSGMRSRLAFSIAIHANAEILLMDEFFGGVGDQNFRLKAEKVFGDRLISGKTIIHVSHSMKTIRQHCDRVLVINNGRGKLFEDPDIAIGYYSALMERKKDHIKKIREIQFSNTQIKR